MCGGHGWLERELGGVLSGRYYKLSFGLMQGDNVRALHLDDPPRARGSGCLLTVVDHLARGFSSLKVSKAVPGN